MQQGKADFPGFFNEEIQQVKSRLDVVKAELKRFVPFEAYLTLREAGLTQKDLMAGLF